MRHSVYTLHIHDTCTQSITFRQQCWAEGHAARGNDDDERVGDKIPPGRPRGCDCKLCVHTRSPYIDVCMTSRPTCRPGGIGGGGYSRARAHTHTHTGRAQSLDGRPGAAIIIIITAAAAAAVATDNVVITIAGNCSRPSVYLILLYNSYVPPLDIVRIYAHQYYNVRNLIMCTRSPVTRR